MSAIPVIDIRPLCDGTQRDEVAKQIAAACRDHGFFYIQGHAVGRALQQRLSALAQEFFQLSLEDKQKIRMELGGSAWRGYFPVGGELTSGKPDQKEGLYFGSELTKDHPRVRAGTPLHGANLFPDLPEFAGTVLEYMRALGDVGHVLMEGLAIGLELPSSYFRQHLTSDPTVLFRIFHYPPLSHRQTEEVWSVGEHTDYGLLTILQQDDTGGLQIFTQGQWIEAPPIENTFICNIGDMLDRMTGGLYRSTPHRVRNPANVGRYSYAFFFFFYLDATVQPIDTGAPASSGRLRWDGAELEQFSGTYGQYLTEKVSRVFPELFGSIRGDSQ